MKNGHRNPEKPARGNTEPNKKKTLQAQPSEGTVIHRYAIRDEQP
jgi:hypothetical protein